jgi:hypothetical protein
MKNNEKNTEEERLYSIGSILSKIGGEASFITDDNPDGIYIYTEVQDGSVYGAVFRDDGTQVRYFDPTPELFMMIRELWKIEPIEKRWIAMEYEIHGIKFDVHFTFPKEGDLNDHASVRRRLALKKRYGDKPIIYPPMPGKMTKPE